jgi:DNA-binding beta-propeller fold protein YncE
MPRPLRAGALLLVPILAACGGASSPQGEGLASAAPAADLSFEGGRLPTGQRLDPEGAMVEVGNFPLTMVLSPDGRHAALLLSGWAQQGLQVVDRATGAVVQTLGQPAAFLGLAWSPDGRTIYASGGNQDVVYRYDWNGARAALRDSLILAEADTSAMPNPVAPGETRVRGQVGKRYPAGLALSPDGRTLYVAENLGDALAVVDVGSGRVRQRFPMERYPYGVVTAPDGTVYASAWGGSTVSVFEPAGGGLLRPAGAIEVGRHPSALLLSRDGARLYAASASTDRVAVVDTRARRVGAQLADPPPSGPDEGAGPNALALSPAGDRLYVAEADANAVAVFPLSAATSGVASATGDDRLAGRIPAAWYPTAVAVKGDTLLVVNGKGTGTAPNPGLPQPGSSAPRAPDQYTLGQLMGTLQSLPVPADAALPALTSRVAAANGWDKATGGDHRGAYPPFEHVIYVIKENRTYDQVLGDMPQGDGDTSLVFFPRPVSPNHHALAERFGLFDRFFVNAEVSADGHNWTTAAYATDYVEKTVPSNYSGRGRSYDYEGTNRGEIPEDDAAEPASGYLWDLAERAGVSFRNYGEYVVPVREGDSIVYRGDKPFLADHTNPRFPGFDLDIPDQVRVEEWLREMQEFSRTGQMPALEIVRLPNDHTAGGRAGAPTPRAYMADNDLALGRMIEALTRSPFWKSTVVFVLEDDAQNGPDHVDSHRSPILVISPYNRPGVIHRFANTTDVIATISEILGMEHLSQFDHYGRPLREIFASTPDLRPYTALRPSVPLDERNPPRTAAAVASRRLELEGEDESDDDYFNRILWSMMKPGRAYPGSTRAAALEAMR